MCVCVCATRACVAGQEPRLRGNCAALRRASTCPACSQGRLQSQDLGKHPPGVEDLLQLHELVEADIAVQAERVSVSACTALLRPWER